MRKSHRWECGVLELIDNDDIGKMAAMHLHRTISSTGYEYSGSGIEVWTQQTHTQQGDFPRTQQNLPTRRETTSPSHQIDNKENRPTGDFQEDVSFSTHSIPDIFSWQTGSQNIRESVCSPTFKFISAIMLKHIRHVLVMRTRSTSSKTGESMINSASLELAGLSPIHQFVNHSVPATP